MTQSTVGYVTGYTRQGIAHMETGYVAMPVAILPTLAHLFDVPLGAFFAPVDPEEDVPDNHTAIRGTDIVALYLAIENGSVRDAFALMVRSLSHNA
jgi:DNA-binding XRE family transcriptional regulator